MASILYRGEQISAEQLLERLGNCESASLRSESGVFNARRFRDGGGHVGKLGSPVGSERPIQDGFDWIGEEIHVQAFFGMYMLHSDRNQRDIDSAVVSESMTRFLQSGN